jgi:predicted HicB family RNase H-like nuclease
MTQGKVVRVTVTIRTSKALHTWLVQQAKKNHRSLNVEIEYRLTKQREAEEAAEQKK